MDDNNKLIEKIDTTLRIIVNNKNGITFTEVLNEVNSGSDKIDADELMLILEKLIEDKYVFGTRFSKGDEGWAGYQPTFNGMVFAAQLGYTAIEWARERDWKMARALEKNQKEMQEAQIGMIKVQTEIMSEQTKIQQSVRKLTIWIAFGTIVAAIYYIIQIVVYIKK